ncbi:hypothetical protein HII13_005506 [Brettanomyces bruxellensis]|nr:hypothetical protein HII13_005506 [Brettanomyces bruxellensis]
MKFAKKFQKVLSEETLPDEWIQKAIRYKALKKIINRTVTEMEEVGASRENMSINYEISKLHRQIRPVLRMNVSPLTESLITDKLDKLGYEYDVKPLQLKLNSKVDVEVLNSESNAGDHLVNSSYSSKSEPVTESTKEIDTKSLEDEEMKSENDETEKNDEDDAEDDAEDRNPSVSTISADNKLNAKSSSATPTVSVEKINTASPNENSADNDVIASTPMDAGAPSIDERSSVETSIERSAAAYLSLPMGTSQSILSTSSAMTALNPFDDKPYYEITVSLHQDAKFFQMLYEEIEALNNFTDERESEIITCVEKIGSIVAKTSSPEAKKSDLYVWRKIFQIYTESQIFFSTIERSAGVLSNTTSKIRYGKFLEEIEKQKLVRRFKRKESLEAFMEFKDLNESMLKVSNFQALNIMAISKILKKFDKRTHFKTKQLFPELMEQSEKIDILQGSIGRDICSIVANRLLNIVPQVDDYLCPICCSVAYKPIRLDCGHTFCVRCLVKLQRKGEDRCPLCRKDVVLKADENNLDVSQMEYLKMYFPKEVKKKQAENEKEIFKEQYGGIVDPDSKSCVIM